MGDAFCYAERNDAAVEPLVLRVNVWASSLGNKWFRNWVIIPSSTGIAAPFSHRWTSPGGLDRGLKQTKAFVLELWVSKGEKWGNEVWDTCCGVHFLISSPEAGENPRKFCRILPVSCCKHNRIHRAAKFSPGDQSSALEPHQMLSVVWPALWVGQAVCLWNSKVKLYFLTQCEKLSVP